MTNTQVQSEALFLAAEFEIYAAYERPPAKVYVARAAAELRRLHARVQALEFAFGEWSDKTDWVQETAKFNELGMHRADVLRARIEALHAENEVLKVQLAGANERAQMLCRQKEMWRERAAAQAHSVEDVLARTGQYVTNDASREVAISEVVAAARDACCADTAPTRIVPMNKWQAAIDREMVLAEIGVAQDDADPYKLIQEIIHWNVEVALDVRVSSAARNLQEHGAAMEREACAQALEDAALRLEPEGKRTNQVDRHTACVLRDKAAIIRARGNQ